MKLIYISTFIIGPLHLGYLMYLQIKKMVSLKGSHVYLCPQIVHLRLGFLYRIILDGYDNETIQHLQATRGNW